MATWASGVPAMAAGVISPSSIAGSASVNASMPAGDNHEQQHVLQVVPETSANDAGVFWGARLA